MEKEGDDYSNAEKVFRYQSLEMSWAMNGKLVSSINLWFSDFLRTFGSHSSMILYHLSYPRFKFIWKTSSQEKPQSLHTIKFEFMATQVSYLCSYFQI
jgi:hypothetical protein